VLVDTLTVVWIVLVFSAVVSGAAFVAVLVTRPESEALMALLGVAAFGFSAYSLVVIAEVYVRIDAVLYAFAFMIAGIAGGWSLASTFLERLAQTPRQVEAGPGAAEATGTAAVIIVACIEPHRYEPRSTAGMLQSLADEELLEPSIGTLPFLYFAQKARYRAVGGTSPAYQELIAIAERVELLVDPEIVGRVDHASCAGERRLAARVMEAADAGHTTIVIAELAVGESLHLAAAKREVDALRLETLGVRLVYTEPLSSSERLVAMLARRVLIAAGAPDQTGVVLVGHGQPDSRAHRNPAFDESETAFLSRVRMQLVDSGIPEGNVRIAWAEWRSPDVTSTVRHLVALGCRRVAVLPGVHPLDTIGTRLDLELAVKQARVEDAVSVITLSAWRDDDALLGEIVDRVGAALA
jgi:protoheme ferro-lyase